MERGGARRFYDLPERLGTRPVEHFGLTCGRVRAVTIPWPSWKRDFPNNDLSSDGYAGRYQLRVKDVSQPSGPDDRLRLG